MIHAAWAPAHAAFLWPGATRVSVVLPGTAVLTGPVSEEYHAVVMDRSRSLARLREPGAPWDVLIIGGGATGLGAAVDAATRGYRTVLLEQGDFAQATSSRSTKLVHGGLRYLKQGNLAFVRESLLERNRLLANAPSLVRPLDFIVPLEHWYDRAILGTGLKLYDYLARGQQPHLSRHLSRAETLGLIPNVRPGALRGGMLYSDAQFDDARLAVALAATAAAHGAVVLNYCGAGTLLREGGRVVGVEARDVETGEVIPVRARAVINATGIFTDALRRQEDPAAEPILTYSQGAHLVLPAEFFPGDAAMLVPKTSDGRVLFLVPWLGRVILGTTDTPVERAALEPRALASEVEFLLAHAAHYLDRRPGPGDILSVYAGIRPLVTPGKSARTAAIARDHTVLVGPGGIVTITGGKWTTYRKMAEDAVTRAAEVGGLALQPSVTADLSLEMSGPVGAGEPRLHPALALGRDDVIRAVRHEQARRVEDVLSRRTRSLLLDAGAAVAVAPAVAGLMADELGWSAARQAQEIADFVELARGYRLQA
jgi:glycerol-3-phosphate dehydrogenase